MSNLVSRRAILAGMGGAGLAAMLPRVALAAADTDKRFVFVIQRGAMDGLNVVVPYGDRDYASLRGNIAIAKPGETDGAIDLDERVGRSHLRVVEQIRRIVHGRGENSGSLQGLHRLVRRA